MGKVCSAITKCKLSKQTHLELRKQTRHVRKLQALTECSHHAGKLCSRLLQGIHLRPRDLAVDWIPWIVLLDDVSNWNLCNTHKPIFSADIQILGTDFSMRVCSPGHDFVSVNRSAMRCMYMPYTGHPILQYRL